MLIPVKQYELPDFEILNSKKLKDFFIWIPDKTYIVLGRSNQVETSLFIDQVKRDKIEIFKRPSGGETVIISPKTIVISVKLPILEGSKSHDAFEIINTEIISCLKNLGIKNVTQKGISDIAINQKKILGSAIYKKPEKIFYHAVLNYSENVRLFDKYLKHPQREPDYRIGRKHSDFVTSINSKEKSINIEAIKSSLEKGFERFTQE